MRCFILSALTMCVCIADAQYYFPCSEKLVQPYGICTHITRRGMDYEVRDREMELCCNAGMQWVRSDLDFYNFITSETTYNPDFFNSVLNTTDKYGQQLLGILTWYGRRAWEDPNYGRMIEMLAKAYDGRITHWEALNEVNLFRGIDSLCYKYVGTLKETYEVLKRVNSRNVVLTSGFGELHEPFLSDFSRMSGWKYCDVFNFHTYFEPEGLVQCLGHLKKVMDRDGWMRPVWLTETGMHTATNKNDVSAFYSDLLPIALRRIGIEEKKVEVGVLRDAVKGYDVLSDESVDKVLKPYARNVRFVGLDEIARLSEKKTPVLIVSADEFFPICYFDAVVDYVRRGGTIVLAGGMPFYYDAYSFAENFFRNKVVGVSLLGDLHMAVATKTTDPITGEMLGDAPTHCEANKDIALLYGWRPSPSSPARYLSDENLMPGDSLIPLISSGSKNLKYPIAGIYKLNSDLKGNVIFQTRMYANMMADKLAEQARRVPRVFLIAFSYGVEKVFWYNLLSSDDSTYSEDCFGMLNSDFSEKPSMAAYRTLTRMCPDGSDRPKLKRHDGVYHVEWCRPDGQKLHAIWSPIGKRKVEVRKHGKTMFFSYLGEEIKVGKSFVADGGVIYVVGDVDIACI